MRLLLMLLVALSANVLLVAQNMPLRPDQKRTTMIEELLAKMTLEEKIGQMNQYNGFWNITGPVPAGGQAAKKYDDLRSGRVGSMLNVRGVEEVRKVQEIAVNETRLGIPLIIGFDVIHGYKTISPIPLAESASWDLEAIQASAAVAAEEAAAAGINWTFAPNVDISRDARWGRVMEGAGEDPYLGSKIAAARVHGFQGDDLAKANTIAACAKHFAAYGFAEAGRDYNTADIGTSTLYNVVFPPFRAAANAGVATFMNSFNDLNGVPATGDAWLQREILKGKWDWDGFVISDWGSMVEMIAHGHASDLKDAALKAVVAGSDMDMESSAYLGYLKELVESGQVETALLDDAVRRILGVKYDLGLFEDPYRYCDEAREKVVTGSEENQVAVLEMAKRSIVLLKNENNLLPLPRKGKKIALIGALADDKNSPLGSWRIAADDSSAVSVLEGMERFLGNEILHARGPELVAEGPVNFIFETAINETDTTGFAEAIATAKQADIVVLVLGEYGWQSGEGRSRTELDLPGLQQQLLEAVHAVNPNCVLVLQNGRPLALPWAAEHIPAIVEGWHLGTQSGNAIAQVLYGDYNPSGKLPMSFPRNVGQVPIYYNHKSTGRPVAPEPNMVFWSHYMDAPNTPLFPFGHGLSYTTFSYGDFKVFNGAEANTFGVNVTVTNTGTRTGEEVVQLYVQDEFASVTRPVKELKGFKKIELAPGESQLVAFMLTEEELGFYNNQGKFVVEPGTFNIMIGGSSETEFEEQVKL